MVKGRGKKKMGENKAFSLHVIPRSGEKQFPGKELLKHFPK